MANILVTGGKGFIGTNLTTELRRRGHDVWTCDLLQGEDLKHWKADVGVYQQMDAMFRKHKFDYVYHLAAEFGRWNGEDFYESLWRTNAVGTKNVIRLQERLKFRLIHFSSSEVYGDWPEIMVESVMDAYEIKQLNDYAMSKWVNEMQIRNSG